MMKKEHCGQAAYGCRRPHVFDGCACACNGCLQSRRQELDAILAPFRQSDDARTIADVEALITCTQPITGEQGAAVTRWTNVLEALGMPRDEAREKVRRLSAIWADRVVTSIKPPTKTPTKT